MRILQIAGSFAPARIGGPAVAAERVCAALRDRGHEVIVLTSGPGTALRYEVHGLPVIGVAADAVPQLVPDLLAMVRPDLVHAHSPRLLGPEPLRLAQAAGYPSVASCYGAEPALPADLLAAAGAVVAESTGPETPAGARVIPTGALPPPAGWQPAQRRGPIRLGFLGGLDPDQGLGMLLQALSQIRRSDYELHVVDRASALGVRQIRDTDVRAPGLVRLLPAFDPWHPADFFGGIDVLISLPGSPGHLNLAMRDALAHGVWPVATDIPANRAMTDGGRDGDLVAPGSVADLAHTLDRVLDRPAGRPDPLGRAVPTVADQAAALEALYAEIRNG